MTTDWQWWSSDSDENYQLGPFLTKEEAINAAKHNYPNQTVYVIRAKCFEVSDIKVDVGAMMYEMEVDYEDFCNPDSETLLEYSREQFKKLETEMNNTFQKWIRDNNIKLSYISFEQTDSFEKIKVP